MISLGKNVGDFTSTPNKYKKPTPGYYVTKVVKSTITMSTKNNPMWALELEIAEGEYTNCFGKYPRRWRQVLHTDLGKEITGLVIQRFVESNEGMINPDVINSPEFDESVVTGLLIGAEFITNEKGYLDVDNLCSIQYAREQQAKSATEEPIVF